MEMVGVPFAKCRDAFPQQGAGVRDILVQPKLDPGQAIARWLDQLQQRLLIRAEEILGKANSMRKRHRKRNVQVFRCRVWHEARPREGRSLGRESRSASLLHATRKHAQMRGLMPRFADSPWILGTQSLPPDFPPRPSSASLFRTALILALPCCSAIFLERENSVADGKPLQISKFPSPSSEC